MADTPKLAVVVPATDAAHHLPRCLDAIRRAQPAPDELVVVREPSGAGPAAARNAGAAQTTAEIIVFVDSDVAVHPDAFARIRGCFAADPELAAVFGSYDDSPAAPGAVSQFRNLLHHHVHSEASGVAASFWAGLGAVRRQAFERVGGFDEQRYKRPSIEDVELGARLHAAGARIELDPQICGTHLKSWSLLEMVRTDFLHRGLPWSQLLLERALRPRGLNLGRRHTTSAAAAVVLACGVAARRRRTSWLAAATLLVLNRRFYMLVRRRAGPRVAVLAPPLHVVHHLAAAASLAYGVTTHVALRIVGRRR